MIRAVFFDVDGTLLSHHTHRVPPSAVRALAALREKGILTFLATGRHISSLQAMEPLQGLQFDGIISLNGQHCRNDREVIYRCPMDRRDVAMLLDHLKQVPHPCILIEEDQMYINFHNALVEKVQAGIRAEMPPLGDLDRGYTQPIYQALLYISEADLAKLPPLPGIRFSRWRLGSPELCGADLFPASGGKSVGIQKVLEYYGLHRSETMAFGDGENDVDMFGAVGISVAMGNGCEAARQAASWITDEADADGIRNALEHFGLL